VKIINQILGENNRESHPNYLIISRLSENQDPKRIWNWTSTRQSCTTRDWPHFPHRHRFSSGANSFDRLFPPLELMKCLFRLH